MHIHREYAHTQLHVTCIYVCTFVCMHSCMHVCMYCASCVLCFLCVDVAYLLLVRYLASAEVPPSLIARVPRRQLSAVQGRSDNQEKAEVEPGAALWGFFPFFSHFARQLLACAAELANNLQSPPSLKYTCIEVFSMNSHTTNVREIKTTSSTLARQQTKHSRHWRAYTNIDTYTPNTRVHDIK